MITDNNLEKIMLVYIMGKPINNGIRSIRRLLICFYVIFNGLSGPWRQGAKHSSQWSSMYFWNKIIFLGPNNRPGEGCYHNLKIVSSLVTVALKSMELKFFASEQTEQVTILAMFSFKLQFWTDTVFMMYV